MKNWVFSVKPTGMYSGSRHIGVNRSCIVGFGHPMPSNDGVIGSRLLIFKESMDNNNLSIGWVCSSCYEKNYGFITRFSDNKVFFYLNSYVDKSLLSEKSYTLTSGGVLKKKDRRGLWVFDKFAPYFIAETDMPKHVIKGTIVVFRTRASKKERDIAYDIKRPIQYKDIYLSHLSKIWGENEQRVYELLVPSVRFSFNKSAIERINQELEKYKKLIHCLNTYIDSIDLDFLLSHCHLKADISTRTKIGDNDDHYLVFVSESDINVKDYYKSLLPEETSCLFDFYRFEDRYLRTHIEYCYTYAHASTYGGSPGFPRLDSEIIKKELAVHELKFRDQLKQSYSKQEHKNQFSKELLRQFCQFLIYFHFYWDNRENKDIFMFSSDYVDGLYKTEFSVNGEDEYNISLHFFKEDTIIPDSLKGGPIYYLDIAHKFLKDGRRNSYGRVIMPNDDDGLSKLEEEAEHMRKSYRKRLDDLINQ